MHEAIHRNRTNGQNGYTDPLTQSYRDCGDCIHADMHYQAASGASCELGLPVIDSERCAMIEENWLSCTFSGWNRDEQGQG